MAEPSTITAAACAATVAICAPFLVALGLDPTDTVFAAMGCVCAQTLLPNDGPRDVLNTVKWAVGSVILATLLTPWIGPMVAKGDTTVRHILAAGVGAFAQPVAIMIRSRVLSYLKKRAGNA